MLNPAKRSALTLIATLLLTLLVSGCATPQEHHVEWLHATQQAATSRGGRSYTFTPQKTATQPVASVLTLSQKAH